MNHLRVPFGLQLTSNDLLEWNVTLPSKKSRKSKLKKNKTLKKIYKNSKKNFEFIYRI
jgi:hypothetical protein